MKVISVKRYRLSVSRIFPTTHYRKGEPTFFREKIYNAIFDKDGDWSNAPGPVSRYVFDPDFSIKEKKLHTCIGKYDKWAKIMAEVQDGKAVIDLYYWDGVPYRKGIKQVVFATLDKDSGCGVQKLYFSHSIEFPRIITEDDLRLALMPKTLAKNDGLSLKDFKAWFKGADLSKPMAIIHFTNFRY